MELDNKLERVRILSPLRLSGYQRFLQWFHSACCARGIESIEPIDIPWRIRQVAAKFGFSRNFVRGSRLIVPCAGLPDPFAFPYAYAHEIIPVMWDTWPRYHERLIASFQRHRVRLAFFTQRQVAELVQQRLPAVRCVWMPEGIDPEGYHLGTALQSRRVDLLELGRLMPRFHAEVRKIECEHRFRDPREGLLFPDFTSLAQGLSDAKITVCFPRCDTHPEHGGNIETLTQRYWECMLSRTLIVGRAPKELVDFIGYNPVVEVDWNDPAGQVANLIENIAKYQDPVDRNREIACRLAPWSARMDLLLNELGGEGAE
jgi:hypothetical protein